jgi:hypothetical protein
VLRYHVITAVYPSTSALADAGEVNTLELKKKLTVSGS